VGASARGPLGERVALITLSAGMSGKLIDAAVAAGYEGIVLAGLGSGNAPDAVVEAVGRALGAGVAVALGTRCLAGSVDGVYSRGQILDHVAQGRLIRVLEDWCEPFPGYHLYYPSRHHASSAFGVVVEALRYRGG
jgi:DNA-binding transcriptional LysR family regulator